MKSDNFQYLQCFATLNLSKFSCFMLWFFFSLLTFCDSRDLEAKSHTSILWDKSLTIFSIQFFFHDQICKRFWYAFYRSCFIQCHFSWQFCALFLRPQFATWRWRNHANHVPCIPCAPHVIKICIDWFVHVPKEINRSKIWKFSWWDAALTRR